MLALSDASPPAPQTVRRTASASQETVSTGLAKRYSNAAKKAELETNTLELSSRSRGALDFDATIRSMDEPTINSNAIRGDKVGVGSSAQ
jgi:hypothetical protein